MGQPIVVDQSAIDTFGDVVHDRQWIHVDPVRAAAESPFGTTIAHGLLTLSLITGWYHQLFEFPGRKLALNYGFDKVRFPAPVPSGSAWSAASGWRGSTSWGRTKRGACGRSTCAWRAPSGRRWWPSG